MTICLNPVSSTTKYVRVSAAINAPIASVIALAQSQSAVRGCLNPLSLLNMNTNYFPYQMAQDKYTYHCTPILGGSFYCKSLVADLFEFRRQVK